MTNGSFAGREAARSGPLSVSLRASDGQHLSAMYFQAATPTRGRIVVANAIGVPQRFYRHFARYAAGAGFATMTFDYRGIGLSAPESLKGAMISALDWGRLDLAAAVAAMSAPDVPLYIVAHSFGGHAFGLLPNPHRVVAVYSFGTGAGWHGWMPPAERIKVLAMWHLLGPLLTRYNGYLSWNRLGMGEDLPLSVYREWKQWCKHPNYFFGEPSLVHLKEQFAGIRTPIAAASSIDDRWSPPASRDAFMAGYRNARVTRLNIDPARRGLPPLGHMGYFMPKAKTLWGEALNWLEASSMTSRPSDRVDPNHRMVAEVPASGLYQTADGSSSSESPSQAPSSRRRCTQNAGA